MLFEGGVLRSSPSITKLRVPGLWYTAIVHNWDYDLTTMDGGKEAELWQLERSINYGLRGAKLSPLLLREYWEALRIPPERRFFLSLLI